MSLAVLAVALSATRAQNVGLSPLTELERARARWAAAGIATYEYTFKQGGLIPPPFNQSVRCVVDAAGSRTEFVAREGDSAPLALPPTSGPGPLSQYCGMQALFDVIERALTRAQPQPPEGGRFRQLWRPPVTVYDAQLGYPTRIVIDLEPRAVDDEFILFVEDFAPRQAAR